MQGRISPAGAAGFPTDPYSQTSQYLQADHAGPGQGQGQGQGSPPVLAHGGRTHSQPQVGVFLSLAPLLPTHELHLTSYPPSFTHPLNLPSLPLLSLSPPRLPPLPLVSWQPTQEIGLDPVCACACANTCVFKWV